MPVFLSIARNAKTTTMKVSVFVTEEIVMPTEDKPKYKPEIPAMLKLKATDKTVFSIMSSLPSLKSRLTKQ